MSEGNKVDQMRCFTHGQGGLYGSAIPSSVYAYLWSDGYHRTTPEPVSLAERTRAHDALMSLKYYINNPSAWTHFDQSVSDAILRAVSTIDPEARAALDAEDESQPHTPSLKNEGPETEPQQSSFPH